jgi:hypothetical protein
VHSIILQEVRMGINYISYFHNIFIRHEHGELLSDRDINSVIDDIGILFDDNAKNVFGTKSSLSHDDSCFMKSLSTGSTFAVKPWCLFSPYI